jgi:hypothetical protein
MKVLVAVLLVAALGYSPPAVGRPSWKMVRSAHFQIRTDAEATRYQPVVDRLEDMHEALTSTFFADLPVPPIDVLLFARDRDFKTVAPENLVGFFNSKVAGLGGGLLVFSSESRDFQVVADTAAHELAHRFLIEVSERVPTWLHEGFAKYVGASRIAGDRVIFDAAATLPADGRRASPLPLERVLASSSDDFHGADARSQYLTSWMLMRQLLRDPGPTSLARFQKLVARSAAALSSPAQAEAVREAFGGVTLAEIERSIDATHDGLVRGVRVPDVGSTWTARLARRGRRTVEVTPIDPSTVEGLCAELRTERGR